jgi:prolyl-tRNA synthetase
MPLVLIVGRGWADGKVELRDRFSGATEELGPHAAVAAAVAAARG